MGLISFGSVQHPEDIWSGAQRLFANFVGTGHFQLENLAEPPGSGDLRSPEDGERQEVGVGTCRDTGLRGGGGPEGP